MITIYFSVHKKKGSLKSNVIQDVTTAEIHAHFGRMYCVLLKGQRVSQASSKCIELVSLILIAASWACASTLNMETVCSSDSLENFYQATQNHITSHSYSCKNINS